MKTYCKENLLRDKNFCYLKVVETFKGKWQRREYQKALCHFCKMPLKEVRKYINENNKEKFTNGLYEIVDEFQEELNNKKFCFSKILYKEKLDGISNKTRLLGIESVKQQCFEHIVVGALMPLFNAKIEEHQYASLKGRGQVAGMQQIRKWIKNDVWAEKCAFKHRQKYSKQCKYFVKLDIQKCFPSMSDTAIMNFLRHDITKNNELLWAVEEILNWHIINGHGLIIGSLLSQFICNYIMSYAYRYAKSLHKTRHNKPIKLITHALFFMDDILLMSSDKRNLKIGIKKITAYIEKNLHLKVKTNWHIKNIDEEPINMMGYIIHYDGHVTIRSKIFIRARRAYLRIRRHKYISEKMARRIIAYNGYFSNTNSNYIRNKLHIRSINYKLREIISQLDRRLK